MFDLLSSLERILPAAIAWAEARAREIAETGVAPNPYCVDLAKQVGVQNPERVRFKIVDALPLPDDKDLRETALHAGLLGPGMVGLTLGYGIYIVRGHDSSRLVSHELRHVHQYELAGSIAAFLPVYLGEVARHGYMNAPLEQDARAHEIAA